MMKAPGVWCARLWRFSPGRSCRVCATKSMHKKPWMPTKLRDIQNCENWLLLFEGSSHPAWSRLVENRVTSDTSRACVCRHVCAIVTVLDGEMGHGMEHVNMHKQKNVLHRTSSHRSFSEKVCFSQPRRK